MQNNPEGGGGRLLVVQPLSDPGNPGNPTPRKSGRQGEIPGFFVCAGRFSARKTVYSPRTPYPGPGTKVFGCAGRFSAF
jgi:hypothetical protein